MCSTCYTLLEKSPYDQRDSNFAGSRLSVHMGPVSLQAGQLYTQMGPNGPATIPNGPLLHKEASFQVTLNYFQYKLAQLRLVQEHEEAKKEAPPAKRLEVVRAANIFWQNVMAFARPGVPISRGSVELFKTTYL